MGGEVGKKRGDATTAVFLGLIKAIGYLDMHNKRMLGERCKHNNCYPLAYGHLSSFLFRIQKLKNAIKYNKRFADISFNTLYMTKKLKIIIKSKITYK